MKKYHYDILTAVAVGFLLVQILDRLKWFW